MKITGKQTNNQINQFCCYKNINKQDALILDNKCFRSLLDECKRICLSDLSIPISAIIEGSASINGNSKLSLNDFNICIIYVEDNNELLHKIVEPDRRNTDTLRYKLNIGLQIDDITFNDILPLKVTTTLTPENSYIAPTWDTLSNYFISNDVLNVWKNINFTWNNLHPFVLSNTLKLPIITKLDNISVYNVGGVINNNFVLSCTKDNVNFDIYCTFNYNVLTNTFNFDITDIKLKGNLYSDNLIYKNTNVSFTMVDNKFNAVLDFDLLTTSAEYYKRSKSLIFTSSMDIINELELFNDESDIKKINYLLAKI